MNNNNSKTVWVFDVDGVITNPTEKRITQHGLVEAIAKKIDDGNIVTFNTGRSTSYTEERVLSPILQVVNDKTKLSDLFIVGEKGATWAFFRDGRLITEVDKTCALPDSLKKELRELVYKEFSESMFYDESKLTLISIEMLDGYKIEDYKLKQHVLIEKVKEILRKPAYNKLNIRIDSTIIAIDVQAPLTGKHMGARRIEKWLREKGIVPSRLIMIGDSQFDTEMAEELQDEYLVKFVFVGDPTKLDTSKLKNEPILTKASYEGGTLEILQGLK